MRWLSSISSLLVFAALATPSWGAVRLTLDTNGGFVVGGGKPNYTAGFGAVNGLGVGVPGAGVTLIGTTASGALYASQFAMTITGAGNPHLITIAAHVSSNFANPAAISLRYCPVGGACGTLAGYTALSTNAGSPSLLLPSAAVGNGGHIGYLAVFVSNTNGASAFSGATSATVSFWASDSRTNQVDTATLTLNNPIQNVQTALSVGLATAPGGVAVGALAINFGNVNGLAIGTPAAGLTLTPVAGGARYSTPVIVEPRFASFSSTTGTVTMHVSTDFARPALLQLQVANAAGGPYTNISKSAATPTAAVAGAASGSQTTRYFGLFVSNINTGFPGAAGTAADSAVLTFTLTVP